MLHEFGVRSGFRIAAGVGYTDDSSLYRLIRTLTEEPWGELLAENPADILAAQFEGWAAG